MSHDHGHDVLSSQTRSALATAGLEVDSVLASIEAALAEDLGATGDLTSAATIDPRQRIRGAFTARHAGVVAGIPVLRAVIELVCGADLPSGAVIDVRVDDGSEVAAGTVIAEVEATTTTLLTAERTALNYLGHLSGIATLTRAWMQAVAGTGATVRDTRKTRPGLRVLEKYAVRCGGGTNHRMGLYDAALIKDNHIAAAGGIAAAIERVRQAVPGLPIEVEVDTLEQLEIALSANVDEILLDNFDPGQMRRAVERRNELGLDVVLEASGGLSLARAAKVAATGVDYIAVGELTHSAPVLDIGLDLVPNSSGA
jgi:nicotinate-nucleotide pyrophosphorylase (carboxylating)